MTAYQPPAPTPFNAPAGPSIPQHTPRTRRDARRWREVDGTGEPAWMEEWRAGVDDKIDALTSGVSQLVAQMQRWMGEVPSRQEMQRADELRVERSAYEVANRGFEGQLRDIHRDLDELREGITELRKGQDAANQRVLQQRIALDGRTIGWFVAIVVALLYIFGNHLSWR